MPPQYDVQTAMTDMESRIMERFDVLESRSMTAATDGAALAERVKSLEQKAGWIGASIGAIGTAALGALLGLMKWTHS